MKELYKDQIGIYENVFSKEYCDHLIDLGEKHISTHGKYRDLHPKFVIDDVHLSLGRVISKKSENHLWEGLTNCVALYRGKYSQFDAIDEGQYRFNDMKWQKTKPFQGYNVYHSEYVPHGRENLRWGVYTVYLNDIEEGGETEFLYQGYRLSPKTGTVCIFPAYFTHTHRGNPPFKKDKYIVTGWMEFLPDPKTELNQKYTKEQNG